MRSTNRKRVLVVSGAIILLCMMIIAGMTFALFTDSKRMSNHLRAGDLEVTLTRTYLEYSVLDANGKLAVTKNTIVFIKLCIWLTIICKIRFYCCQNILTISVI